MSGTLKCHCSQPIRHQDVMHREEYRRSGTVYMYIKFRCPHCKKLGEHFIPIYNWKDALLPGDPIEIEA